MAIHDITWLYMALDCYTWLYMAIHGNIWHYMVIHGYTWHYTLITLLKVPTVISDHKYSGHNNSVRVEFCSPQRVVSATFWFTNEGKVFLCLLPGLLKH